jgi:hypothetical protein
MNESSAKQAILRVLDEIISEMDGEDARRASVSDAPALPVAEPEKPELPLDTLDALAPDEDDDEEEE